MWNTREAIGSLQRASGTRRKFKELTSAIGNLKVFKKLGGGIGKSITKGYEPWSGGGGWTLAPEQGIRWECTELVDAGNWSGARKLAENF